MVKSPVHGIVLNEGETNCGIVHILGILLLNCYATKILPSVPFEYSLHVVSCKGALPKGGISFLRTVLVRSPSNGLLFLYSFFRFF